MSNNDKLMPLTLTQQDIYFDQLRNIDSPLYNVGGYIQFKSIDVEKIAQAHKKVVNNNDAFGIRIVNKGQTLTQYISKERTVELEIIDFSAFDDASKSADRWLKTLFESPMLIDECELFKAYLIKISNNEYRYVGFAHHLIMDGLGFSNWAEKLGCYYNKTKFDANNDSWKSVIDSDVKYLSSERYIKNKKYWEEQLKQVPNNFLAPQYRFQFKNTQSVPSARTILKISPEMHQKLIVLAKNNGVTVSQFYLVIMAIYFYQAYEQEDFLIGIPAHNRRNHAEKNMVGVFTSVSPLLVSVNKYQNLLELCQNISKTQKKNFRHQRYPIGHIKRDLGELHNNQMLYDISFNYLKLDSEFQVEENQAELVYLSHNNEQTPLMLTIWEYGNGLPIEVQVDHNLSYLSTNDATLMIKRFEWLIYQLATKNIQRIDKIKLLPDDEYTRLCSFSVGNSLAYPSELLIHQLFEQKVAVKTNEISVICNEESISFYELNQRANQVAHYLLEKGISNGDFVGICLNRNIDMIVAVMAILKSGAAYVALDPTYPISRLRYIIEDCSVKYVFIEEDFFNKKLVDNPITLNKTELFDSYPKENINANCSSEQLAYVIYTSGSTGMPKGVAIRHRNVSAMLHWASHIYTDKELSRILASTSLNFDLSAFELFLPLCFGYQCVLVDNALSLLDKQYDVSLINTVPSAIKVLIEKNAIPSYVEVINLAGEPLSANVVNHLLENNLCKKVYNLYGPSEDTTYSTYAKFETVINHVPEIGNVISNSQAFVLSESKKMSPLGIVGELYLGGEGVAAGYINRQELTADKFLPNPFGDGVLYKTGDLVRYQDDGSLLFVGRADEQIKIRGFRVELGEIEFQLTEIADIDEAIIKVIQQQLVAYIIVNKKIEQNVVKEKLKQYLPDYMIPSFFVEVENWPLTQNGKIDKKLLPEPKINDIITDSNNTLMTKTERVLSGIYANLLNIELTQLSPQSDFFELGGHSLLAVNLTIEIQKLCDVEIALKVVFQKSSIKEMALHIDGCAVSSYKKISCSEFKSQFPLSFSQQRLWFISQLEPDSPEYNMPAAFKVKGDFNLVAAENTLKEIISKHEILKVNFLEIGDEVFQKINESFDFSIIKYDFSGFDEEQKNNKLNRFFDDFISTPFDLKSDMLIRVAYINLGKTDSINVGALFFNMHHIISDGISLSIFINEFVSSMKNFEHNKLEKTDVLKVKYSDFVLWQQNQLKNSELDKQREYWLSNLSDAPVLHGLPLDYPRPKEKAKEGGLFIQKVSRELTEQLNLFSQKEKITPFMLLHAVFALVISRNSESKDILIGTPVANRPYAELRNVIGFFVNTLVLRANTNYQSLAEYLKHIKEVNFNGFDNQDIPFEQVVESCNVLRSRQHTPLVQIMLSMSPVELDSFDIPNLEITQISPKKIFSKYDLELNVELKSGALVFNWIYDSSIFELSKIKMFSQHFEKLLCSVVKNKDDDLNSLQMLTDQEVKYLTDEVNNKILDYPKETQLHRLFENQAQLNPNKIAFTHGSEKVTFSQLNKKSNQLANYILSLGVVEGSFVGINLERTVDMIVSILAVLKAGCVYVPIDPNYPKSRCQFIIDDCQVNWLISENDLSKNLKVKNIITLNNCSDFKKHSIENVKNKNNSKQLAYVIYTSGSTGKPKGVAIRHSNALAMLFWAKSTYTEIELSKVLASTSLNFDLSIFEIFVPLCFGFECVLVRDALVLTEKKIDVSLINTVPSVIKQLIKQDSIPSNVKSINLAGEPLSTEIVNTLLSKELCEKVYNLYGPSEDTTYSTFSVYTKPISGSPHIGKVIHNTQAFILSRDGFLVPKGVVGELYLGGAGVAKGYINNQELTKEKFLLTSYSEEVLYRTGDLVRYMKDGNIEFIGRIDDQVKIRGFRVELGEIENALLSCSDVTEAIVIAKDNEKNEKYLIAYLKTKNQDGVTNKELITFIRQLLKDALPVFMIPSAFMVIDNWPLTNNGKIDKKALPTPDVTFFEDDYLEAKTKTEKILVESWASLLEINREKISITANFFELGGHSLIISQMIHNLANQYDIHLSVKDIFTAPTIVELANLIESASRVTSEKLTKGNQVSTSSLSYAQHRIWLTENIKGSSTQHNLPFALKVKGDVDVSRMESTLSFIVDKHDILRTSFNVNNNLAIQNIHSKGNIKFNFHDLSQLHEDKKKTAKKLIEKHSLMFFELSDSSLMSTLLLKINEFEYFLHFNFHHIIFDGWSAVIFINELLSTYEKINTLKPLSDDKKDYSYQDYISWQNRFLSSNEAKKQCDFWCEYLNGSTEQITLPFQEKNRELNSNDAGLVAVKLTSKMRKDLLFLASRNKASLFNVLYSTFVLLVSRLTGENDFNIGVPVSGRNLPGTQDILGVFLNNLPIRNKMDFDLSFSDFLKYQNKNIEMALSNQELPFEKILEISNAKRNISVTPLFQLFFNMLSLPAAKSANKHFDISMDEVIDVGNKFNLSIYAMESENGIDIRCNFNILLFARENIEHLLQQYISLLAQVSKDESNLCGEFDLKLKNNSLPKLREAINRKWKGAVPYCFRDIARKYPENIALEFLDRSITYKELDLITDWYAEKLKQKSVGVGDVVGIMTQRTDTLVIATLATLKSGAAFMMLSSTAPELRVLQQINIVEPKCIIDLDNTYRFGDKLKSYLNKIACPILTIYRDVVISELNVLPHVELKESDSACIGFTSGTSGTPKAVIGRHSSLTAFMPWMAREFSMSVKDRFGMMSGLVHDPLQRDMFTPLCMGATLCIPCEDKLNSININEWIRDNKVTILHLTPSLGTMLTNSYKKPLDGLRLGFFVGEALTNIHVNNFKLAAPNMQIINLYGSTETGRAVSYYRVDSSKTSREGREILPVGVGIDGVQLIVFNQHMKVCGVGEIGQIGIRSHHLSLGYNDVDLTQKMFIQNPLSDDEKDVIYLTGDVGRYTQNGQVECLGRIDKQIKIRGFRVELAEIEAVIQKYKNVKGVVVSTKTSESNEHSIVAYVVLSHVTSDVSQTKDLRDFCATFLPNYMIPTYFIFIDEIPLTENGKINWHALPKVEISTVFGEFVAAETTTEIELVEIWREILQLESQKISVESSFFELGGHSLLVSKLIYCLNEKYNFSLTFYDFFENNTIRFVAKKIDDRKLLKSVLSKGDKTTKRNIVI